MMITGLHCTQANRWTIDNTRQATKQHLAIQIAQHIARTHRFRLDCVRLMYSVATTRQTQTVDKVDNTKCNSGEVGGGNGTGAGCNNEQNWLAFHKFALLIFLFFRLFYFFFCWSPVPLTPFLPPLFHSSLLPSIALFYMFDTR